MRYLLAVLTAALLAVGSWGVAYASEDTEQDPARSCEVVSSELASVQAKLDGARTAASQMGLVLPLDEGVLADLTEKAEGDGQYKELAQEKLDAAALVKGLAADVSVLEQRQTDCTNQQDEDNNQVVENCPEGQVKLTDGETGETTCVDATGGNNTGQNQDNTDSEPVKDSNDTENDSLNLNQFDDIPNTSNGVNTGAL